jgi:hypothetical protein
MRNRIPFLYDGATVVSAAGWSSFGIDDDSTQSGHRRPRKIFCAAQLPASSIWSLDSHTAAFFSLGAGQEASRVLTLIGGAAAAWPAARGAFSQGRDFCDTLRLRRTDRIGD